MTVPDATGPAVRGPSLAETFLRPFMKLAAVQPGERVLDIAPGGGEAAVEAALRAGDTGELLLVDPRAEVLASVAAAVRAAGAPAPRTYQADPASTGEPAAYWDVVLCHFGLTDMADPEAAVAEAYRVLRPVGRLAVSAPGERDRCPLITIFLDALAAHVPAATGEAHALFRYSTPGKLATMLAERGFEDAVPDRLTEWVPFAGVDDYWDRMAATRLGAAAARLSPEAVAACKAEIERRTRFYRRGGGIELKVEAILLTAVK